MADTTAISWTEHTWNPWRGCTKISPGCKNCYMYTAQLRLAKRYKNPGILGPVQSDSHDDLARPAPLAA